MKTTNNYRKKQLSAPLPPKDKYRKSLKGFTLAEILITLVIIGVVATLAIPPLRQKQYEQEAISGVSNIFYILSTAFKLAEKENGPIETWDLSYENKQYSQGGEKIAKMIFPHLKIQKDCKNETGCFPDAYQTLQGTPYYENLNTNKLYYKAMLENGASIAIWTGGSCKDTNISYYNNKTCGSIRVDLNGSKPPNKAGLDLFLYTLSADGLLPTKPVYTSTENVPCRYQGTEQGNGLSCTGWVFYKKNLDYLRKDVKWE